MNFLYPSFLWALTALSIPILIHLFNFRRTTRVYFSSTRFLKHVKEVTTAKRKLKHYLILAARLLFLTFLVLAFAQPIIPASEQLGDNRSLVFYIDNSQSMSAQLDDNTRALDASIGFARNIIELFPPDTRYKIITNDFAPFSNVYKAKAEALDVLTQIRLSPVSRSVLDVKERIDQDSEKRSKEVFWISDFQKSTVGPFPTAWDSTSRWHLVPMKLSESPNIFIDSAYLENPFAASGERNVLHIRVRNDGDRDVAQLSLKLMINNIQAATTSISVPQSGVRETGFDLTTGLTGLREAKVSFNDFPVSFDNEFYIALNFTEKIRVVEIRNSTTATPIERVFGNTRIFDFSGYPVNNFNYSLLKQADLVVVNGLTRIDASLQATLREYISQFGTIFIIPAADPDVVSYQNLIGRPVKVNPGKVMEALDRPDFNNPFFENVFEEKSVSLAMPKATAVLDWGDDRTAILRFGNNKPFLSRLDQGGKLYVLASPLEAVHTDFFNNALFVPVMYRLAASSKKNENRLYYTLKENFITLRLDSLRGEEPLRLAGQQEITPAQRRMQNQVMLDIPKFSLTQGFYHVLYKRDTVGLVAFNLDKAESLLEQYAGVELSKQVGEKTNISIFESGSPDTFSNEIKARYLGKPLWKYALMLALIFLLTEALLIRFLK
ncbi:MAG: BatA and WFA domain-containing protein [Cyclobacteriaceae bacterium]|nr:BatA and WFA domain-containing protein [Cyclobacteriaceae bacterium]